MPSVSSSNEPQLPTHPDASSAITVPGRNPSGPADHGRLREAHFAAEDDVGLVPASSVMVRLSWSPPGLNSVTVPSTKTSSPTARSGLLPVKTKRPDEVASLSSAAGSWTRTRCYERPSRSPPRRGHRGPPGANDVRLALDLLDARRRSENADLYRAGALEVWFRHRSVKSAGERCSDPRGPSPQPRGSRSAIHRDRMRAPPR